MNLGKVFLSLIVRHCELVSKYDTGLKTLLLQGLSEPKFNGDLVFRKIIQKPEFSDHFNKIVNVINERVITLMS